MKKIILLTILSCCTILSSCRMEKADTQWFGISYYVWVNNSSDPITVTGYAHSKVDPEMVNVSFSRTLESGERFEFDNPDRSIGAPAPPFFEKIVARFHDGTEIDFGMRNDPDPSLYNPILLPEGYDLRYNIAREDNYTWEDVDSPNGCRQCEGRRWTYTFTDADYTCAKARVEAEGN